MWKFSIILEGCFADSDSWGKPERHTVLLNRLMLTDVQNSSLHQHLVSEDPLPLIRRAIGGLPQPLEGKSEQHKHSRASGRKTPLLSTAKYIYGTS